MQACSFDDSQLLKRPNIKRNIFSSTQLICFHNVNISHPQPTAQDDENKQRSLPIPVDERHASSHMHLPVENPAYCPLFRNC
jgi:hypothetical protein